MCFPWCDLSCSIAFVSWLWGVKFHEKKTGVWFEKRKANRSIFGCPRTLLILLKIWRDSCHSNESWVFLDCKSAFWFRALDKYPAVIVYLWTLKYPKFPYWFLPVHCYRFLPFLADKKMVSCWLSGSELTWLLLRWWMWPGLISQQKILEHLSEVPVYLVEIV